jgi:hypothetical protein
MVPSPFRGTLFGAAGNAAPLEDPSASSAGSPDGDRVGLGAELGDAAPDGLPATDGGVELDGDVALDGDVESDGDAAREGGVVPGP